MRQSIAILSCIAVFAVLALLFGRVLGIREDIACPVGGLFGFLLGNAICMGNTLRNTEMDDSTVPTTDSRLMFSAYFISSITCFASVGWLTGFLHAHGVNAGIMCGSFGGAMLAAVLIQIYGKPHQRFNSLPFAALILVLTTALVLMVWIMYFTEMRLWRVFSAVTPSINFQECGNRAEQTDAPKWRVVRVLRMDHRSSPLGDPGRSSGESYSYSVQRYSYSKGA